MIKSVIVALVVAALGTAACAGPYVSLGFGKAFVSDNARNDLSTDALSSSVAGGFRLFYFSAEATYTSYSLVQDGAADYEPFASRSLGLALKASLPIGGHLELYGRAGILRTWLDDSPSRRATSGDGHTVGGGLAYGIRLGLVGVAWFADYTRNQVSFDDPTATAMDQTASIITTGLTVSL